MKRSTLKYYICGIWTIDAELWSLTAAFLLNIFVHILFFLLRMIITFIGIEINFESFILDDLGEPN